MELRGEMGTGEWVVQCLRRGGFRVQGLGFRVSASRGVCAVCKLRRLQVSCLHSGSWTSVRLTVLLSEENKRLGLLGFL